MQRQAFEHLVRQLAREIPPEYLDGVAAIDVSPRTVPHPVREDVYTLGECIPMHGDLDEAVSRIVLYHGSFRALARLDDAFSWRDEAWDTLTHELRHHLEWRANADKLERYDWAADQNFARHEGRSFDPAFYTAGDEIAERVFRVDDDVFLDVVVRALPRQYHLTWRGRRYVLPVPAGSAPLLLTVDGTADPPDGELVVAFRRRAGVLDLFRRPGGPRVAVIDVRADAP